MKEVDVRVCILAEDLRQEIRAYVAGQGRDGFDTEVYFFSSEIADISGQPEDDVKKALNLLVDEQFLKNGWYLQHKGKYGLRHPSDKFAGYMESVKQTIKTYPFLSDPEGITLERLTEAIITHTGSVSGLFPNSDDIEQGVRHFRYNVMFACSGLVERGILREWKNGGQRYYAVVDPALFTQASESSESFRQTLQNF